jgi:phage tail-like protein
MATAGDRNDPLASFNFIVTIENIRAGFTEISGLSTESNIIEYREGDDIPTMTKLPGLLKYTNIVLKRGYTTDGKELFAWRKTVLDGKTERRGGTITLLNEARQPALTWEFNDGWPSKWEGPAMNAKNNDIAIEVLEICHEGCTLQAS